jgi:ribonucleoside-triphosphate reductase
MAIDLATDYQKYIHTSRYSRWREDLPFDGEEEFTDMSPPEYKGRRETWEETVDRYIEFFKERESGVADSTFNKLRSSILKQDVMPSMRCLMTAGPALKRDNVAGYNCSYRAVDDIRAFDEIMYVLLCGTGVGFSVERQYVSQLPAIAEEFHESDTTIVVSDSKLGWASAYRELLSLLYGGKVPKWDVSRVRPKGSRLKTFGGRASGPEPLVDLFKFSIEVFKNAKGRKLTSIECHDLVCKVADIVVVGGVRRSALISLSNLTDERMRVAKSGQWWNENSQRALANNSVCYTEKPDMGIFMREWESLYASKSGERGIFSRPASQRIAERSGRRDPSYDFGTNPCSEIILRSKQFCNLTEVVVRSGDTVETLKAKVRTATILGTLQSTLTDFRYLSKGWQTNTEEERLLGVSLTGIMDHPILAGGADWEEAQLFLQDDRFGLATIRGPEGSTSNPLEEILSELKRVAVETNKLWASKLGIEASTAITCVKPSGTVSQLVDSASGIHPRYSPFYIRTVRGDAKDPVSQLLAMQGVPWEWDEMDKDSDNRLRMNTMVFSFPMKAPAGAVFRDDRTALEQLELWKVYADHWCEHKPSITVYVREHEWMEVGAWVYKNFDCLSGVSFLPHSEHTYQQAPYQEITEEEYNDLVKQSPESIDWSALAHLEAEDATTGTQELACTAGGCELV